MINYVFCALTGTLSFFLADCQSTNAPVKSQEVHRLAHNITLVDPLSQQENVYMLSHKAEVAGWLNKKMIYSGTLRNNKLQGAWQSWYCNGNRLDSGELLNGIPNGEWKVWDSAGQLLAVRHYNANKLQRVKEEMRLGHPKNSFYPLTALYKKDRQSAKRYLQAAYSFSFENENINERSLQQAVEQNITENSAYQPVFHECLHHGVYQNYFSNGALKDSGYYKNGLKDGLWIQNSSSAGSSFTGAYKNGIRQYEWKQYDDLGKLILLVFYNRMGEEEGRKKMGQ